MQFQKRRFIAFFNQNGKEQKEEVEQLTLKGAIRKFEKIHGFLADSVERFGYGLKNPEVGSGLRFYQLPEKRISADKLFESL
jgi:hypothetical protein